MTSTKHPASYPASPASPSNEEVREVYVTGRETLKREGTIGGSQSVGDKGLAASVDSGWRYAAVNDAGRVVGEHHHSAKLSDADIELIHDLRDAGLSYAQIAAKFDDEVRITKQTAYDVCSGRRRSQTVMGHRRVSRRPDFMPADLDEFDIIGGF